MEDQGNFFLSLPNALSIRQHYESQLVDVLSSYFGLRTGGLRKVQVHYHSYEEITANREWISLESFTTSVNDYSIAWESEDFYSPGPALIPPTDSSALQLLSGNQALDESMVQEQVDGPMSSIGGDHAESTPFFTHSHINQETRPTMVMGDVRAE